MYWYLIQLTAVVWAVCYTLCIHLLSLILKFAPGWLTLDTLCTVCHAGPTPLIFPPEIELKKMHQVGEHDVQRAPDMEGAGEVRAQVNRLSQVKWLKRLVALRWQPLGEELSRPLFRCQCQPWCARPLGEELSRPLFRCQCQPWCADLCLPTLVPVVMILQLPVTSMCPINQSTDQWIWSWELFLLCFRFSLSVCLALSFALSLSLSPISHFVFIHTHARPHTHRAHLIHWIIFLCHSY